VDPLGIDVARPRLSWELTSRRRGERQTAYQIRVSGSPDALKTGRGLLWDSGRVASDATAQIVYGGRALGSGQECWWSVRSWDRDGKPSPFSAPARWTMGRLSRSDWKAKWIGLESPTNDQRPTTNDQRPATGDRRPGGRQLVLPPSPFLRKEFAVGKRVRRATLYATALGLYEMRLNGRRVSEDLFRPGWTDYRKRVYYQTYDVTPQLRPGPNVLGAILADGWACGYVGLGGRDRYRIGRPRLLAQLEIAYADGTSETIVSDGSWKATTGPILEADLLMGESYDARLELAGWDRPTNDRRPTTNDRRPMADDWRAVTVYPDWEARLEASPGPPVRRMREVKPVRMTEPSPGVFVFDLGQNIVGWARLAVTGPAGTQVRLRFAEVLNPDGTLYTTNLRGARCVDTYVLKGGGSEVWEPRFTFHGFRYVEVTGYPGRPPRDAITGIVAYSAMPDAGTFACSNPMVTQLQQNIVWGQRGNFLEVPTDCPQRDERLGWTGDAQIFVRTSCHNMDVATFWTKWMMDLVDAQRPNGAFTDVAPYVAAGSGTAAWGDAGIVVPWTLYQVYGDRRILETHYDAMAKWIAYLEQNSRDLLRPARGYGDWVAAGSRTPTDVLATAYFAQSARLLGRMARAIGRTEDARRYEALFGRIRDAFQRAYVTPDGRVKGETQTCYVLALAFDLLPKAQQEAAARYLVEDIQRRDWHLSTGFVGSRDLLPVLTQVGQNEVAYRLLTQESYPSWGYTIRQGATTIWERWDGIRPTGGFQDPGMNSFNHYAFGSVGQWLYSTVAGIDTDPERPGFRHLLIRPRPGGGITWTRATYRSIRGPIATDWRQEGRRFALNVSVPPNTTATIHVPAPDMRAVRESGRPATAAPGLRALGMRDGAAVFAAGSGEYRFMVVSL
jgi:alpha-L-rhamnosidase